MTPVRIQRSRAKGWKMPPNTVYVGRPSRWGNPARVGEVLQHRHRSAAHPYDFYIDRHVVTTVDQATRLYKSLLTRPVEHEVTGFMPPTLEDIREMLRGKNLACWCPLDQPCHADVLLEIANQSFPASERSA